MEVKEVADVGLVTEKEEFGMIHWKPTKNRPSTFPIVAPFRFYSYDLITFSNGKKTKHFH